MRFHNFLVGAFLMTILTLPGAAQHCPPTGQPGQQPGANPSAGLNPVGPRFPIGNDPVSPPNPTVVRGAFTDQAAPADSIDYTRLFVRGPGGEEREVPLTVDQRTTLVLGYHYLLPELMRLEALHPEALSQGRIVLRYDSDFGREIWDKSPWTEAEQQKALDTLRDYKEPWQR